MCVMKLNKYFMIGAMGLSLVACSDNLDENGQSANGTNPNEGTTYVQVALKLDAGTSSRVGEQPEDGTKDPGTAGEQAVNKVRIIITDESDNVEVNQLYTAATSSVDNDILGRYVVAVEPGTKHFYAFVNEGDDNKDIVVDSKFSNTTLATAKTAASLYTAATESAGATNFAMSSTGVVSQPIEDGVTEEEAEAGTYNQVTIPVERMVAKVTVSLAKDFETDTKNFTVKKIACMIGNADNKKFTTPSTYDATGTYRMAYNNDVSGARQTPYYSWSPDEEDAFTGWNETNVMSSEIVISGDDAVADGTAVFYCLENTHAQGSYKKGNTTFIRVQATMIPTQKVTFTITDGEASTKNITPANDLTSVDGSGNASTFYRITNAPAEYLKKCQNTYVMESDLEGYATDLGVTGLDNVIKAFTDAGYALEKYINGVGNYTIWVNDHNKGVTTVNPNLAPVFRNDWYEYSITKIELPGNSGGIDNPGEDIHPDTHLAAKITLNPWNKRHIDVPLTNQQ